MSANGVRWRRGATLLAQVNYLSSRIFAKRDRKNSVILKGNSPSDGKRMLMDFFENAAKSPVRHLFAKGGRTVFCFDVHRFSVPQKNLWEIKMKTAGFA